MEIEITQGNPARYQGDALLVPTNSMGEMVEGLAAQVIEHGGKSIEKEISRSVPIAVGAAVATAGGKLGVSRVIHVPVVEQAGLRMGIENVRRATRAGLLASSHFELDRLCIPGFGYGENGIPFDETARAIIDEIKAFKGTHPSHITLMDPTEEMITAFRQQLEDR